MVGEKAWRGVEHSAKTCNNCLCMIYRLPILRFIELFWPQVTIKMVNGIEILLKSFVSI